jgi:hypothetical protein
MFHGFHHHVHAENILGLLKFFQSIKETIGNILGMTGNQEDETDLTEVSFLDKIEGKPQDLAFLFCPVQLSITTLRVFRLVPSNHL